MFKKKKPWRDRAVRAVLLALAIGSAHGATPRRLDLDGVQEGPQGLSEGAAEETDTGAVVGSGAQAAAASTITLGRAPLPHSIFPPISHVVFHGWRGGESLNSLLHILTPEVPSSIDATTRCLCF